MPLEIVPSLQALKNPLPIKQARKWPCENRGNRLLPLSKPYVEHKVGEFGTGTPVMTIGSCFARYVSLALKELGHDVPTLDIADLARSDIVLRGFLQQDKQVTGVNPPPDFAWNFMQKYNPFSILNELTWALDDNYTPSDEAFFEVLPGDFVDSQTHMPSLTASLEDQKHRRMLIRSLFRRVLECREIVITLGLAEVWWDHEQGCYLNQSPDPNFLKRHHERFEFHVLGYEDVASCLRQMMGLLGSRMPQDFRVFLTVSPQPFLSTFRAQDAMIANTYSKSVLRAAVDEVAAAFDNVFYFPSFEIATLSDPRAVWTKDYLHVELDFVNWLMSFATGSNETMESTARKVLSKLPEERSRKLEEILKQREEKIQMLEETNTLLTEQLERSRSSYNDLLRKQLES